MQNALCGISWKISIFRTRPTRHNRAKSIYLYIREEPEYREKDKAHLFVLMQSENTYTYAEIHVYYQGVNPLSVSQVLEALAK